MLRITTNNTKLLDEPDVGASEIADIPKCTKLLVLEKKWYSEEYCTWFYKVKYKGKTGWVDGTTISDISDVLL